MVGFATQHFSAGPAGRLHKRGDKSNPGVAQCTRRPDPGSSSLTKMNRTEMDPCEFQKLVNEGARNASAQALEKAAKQVQDENGRLWYAHLKGFTAVISVEFQKVSLGKHLENGKMW
jgi:hypothetical protein